MRELKHRRVALEDPDTIRPDEQRDLFDHWLLHSQDGQPPRRALMDMAVMRPVLPNSALVWVERQASGIRYRAFGSRLVDLFGEDPTGRGPMDVYHPEIAREVVEALSTAMRTGKPAYDLCEFKVLGLTIGYRRLLLPLAHEGVDAGYVIVCIYPMQKWLRSAKDWRSILTAASGKPGLAGEHWESLDSGLAANDSQTERVYI